LHQYEKSDCSASTYNIARSSWHTVLIIFPELLPNQVPPSSPTAQMHVATEFQIPLALTLVKEVNKSLFISNIACVNLLILPTCPNHRPMEQQLWGSAWACAHPTQRQCFVPNGLRWPLGPTLVGQTLAGHGRHHVKLTARTSL
jgi:hypothetical protein